MMNRRNFLKKSTLAAAAPWVVPSSVLGANSPSNQITLGFIGMGGQGKGRNLKGFITQDRVQVLAVCDCDQTRAKQAKKIVDKTYQNKDCAMYQDFRELLARDDLDGIVISTPDQWHVPMSLMALEAGKHVFCEKPSLTITEGRDLVTAFAAKDRVFQWGIEDRSLAKYHWLAGWARSGLLGEVYEVNCTLPKHEPFKREDPVAVPKNLDWNLWLGPAPFVDYTPSALDMFHWRLNSDYGGGMLTDWGTHLCDTGQIGLGFDSTGPVEAFGKCRELDPKVWNTDTPVDFEVTLKYANGAQMHVSDSSTYKELLLEFKGTDGWVKCTGWYGVLEASDREILRTRTFGPEANYWPQPKVEHEDFIDAIVAGHKETAYHPEAGHRLCSALHLGHLALREGRTVGWDPLTESFTTDKAANEASVIYRRQARDWESA
ncbi:MAG: Gfo/Idh/MocA family oxidoreductase [Verrucomicrobiota bacterium]